MQLRLQRIMCPLRRCRLTFWALIGLFLLNIVMYVTARRWEKQLAVAQFDKDSSHIDHSLQEVFDHSLSQLRATAAIWEVNPQPSIRDYRAVTRHLVDGPPYVVGLGWASRFDTAALIAWERSASLQFGVPIRAMDGNQRPVDRTKNLFHPIRLVEPIQHHRALLGYDLSSHPDRAKAIEEAARKQKPVATSPILLQSPAKPTMGFLLLYPLLRNGAVDGFLILALRSDFLLTSALGPQPANDLVISIRDVAAGYNLLHRPAAKTQLQYAKTFHFAGRDWQIQIQARDGYIDSRRTFMPEIGFAAGILLVIVMGAQAVSSSRAIITARKQARRRNRKLRRLNRNLRAEVTERAEAEQRLAAYSEQLEQATLLAESSANAKSNFLAMVSHEIRTPMHAIIGMTNILLDSPLNPDQRESAGIVLRSADSLLQIINDILDFSKIEAGKFEFEDVPFDLQQTISEVMDAVSVRASEKGISLMVGYPTDAPVRFLGDGGAVRQILLNLAGNAVKFTERGQIAVDVLVLEEDDSVARMYLSVSDTGVGIPDDRLHRLFHPFQQADSSMRRKFGGTGLGLAISKRLTELLGGVISVDSQLHVGTIFQLDLPLKKDRSTVPSSYCPLDLCSVGVLIAEPNPAVSTILSKQLEGCHISHAQAGDNSSLLASLTAAERPFGIFLIGGDESESWDPAEAVTAIRNRSGVPNPVLIRIAPYAVAGERAAMEEAGFSAYLVMPVFAGVLMNAITQAWAAARLGAVPKPILTRQSLRDDAAKVSLEPLANLCRVLLVEDNAVNQKIGKRLLDKLHCSVDIAANGLAALRQWEPGKYDIVLMDCQMPEMDGFEATAEIRKRELLAGPGIHTRIIAMTANNMQGDREHCLRAGMDDFLPKPVSFAELRNKLDETRQTSPSIDSPVLSR
ncbi:MAG: response regulator [Bryobacterales bacterium]|nr:response regulator [Bryobacterales bacterium]